MVSRERVPASPRASPCAGLCLVPRVPGVQRFDEMMRRAGAENILTLDDSSTAHGAPDPSLPALIVSKLGAKRANRFERETGPRGPLWLALACLLACLRGAVELPAREADASVRFVLFRVVTSQRFLWVLRLPTVLVARPLTPPPPTVPRIGNEVYDPRQVL